TTKRRLIVSQLTRNCRREPGRKRKARARRQSQEINRQLSHRNPRFLPKHWELLLLRFSRLLDRAVQFTIRSLLQGPKARCARRVANSAGKSLAACSAESSAAENADNCSGVCVNAENNAATALRAVAGRRTATWLQEKSPDTPTASGDLSGSQTTAS